MCNFLCPCFFSFVPDGAGGLDLISADILISAMLLAGVAGQLAGGHLSDLFGRKEYVIVGSILAIPSFYGFIFTTGSFRWCSLLVFGFALWSGFAVTVAIAHEMVPGKVAFTSGLMLGASLGAGGLGVAVFGFLADRYSLAATLQSVTVPHHYGRSIDLFPEISLEIMAHFINSFSDEARVREFHPIHPDKICPVKRTADQTSGTFSGLMFFKIKNHITWSLKNYG